MLLISSALTSAAFVLAMYYIGSTALISAGFSDPTTPFGDRVFELFTEVFVKTRNQYVFYGVNFVFDAITVIVSFYILRSLARTNSIGKTFLLIGIDVTVSILAMLSIIVVMQLFHYAMFYARFFSGGRTTSLTIQDITLFLVSATAVVPVLLYSAALFFVAAIRAIFKTTTFVVSRFVDEDKTVFTHLGVLVSVGYGVYPVIAKYAPVFLAFLILSLALVIDNYLRAFFLFLLSNFPISWALDLFQSGFE